MTEYTLKQRGYTVLTTCNGLEGLITAQKEEPDLIILDIMLPGIDGTSYVNGCAPVHRPHRFPFSFCRQKSRQEDISTVFRTGANDYLAKPASPSEIISRVESLLSESAVTQSSTIAFLNLSKNLGMTTILANLATAIAEREKQVVIVDIAVSQSPASRRDEAEIPTTGAVILGTDPAGQLQDTIDELADDLSAVEYKSQYFNNAVKYISNLGLMMFVMPDNLSFSSIELRENGMTLYGYAPNPHNIVKFAENLESSGRFSEANIMWINDNKDKPAADGSNNKFLLVINK